MTAGYEQRLFDEHQELNSRIALLEKFMQTAEFTTLPANEKHDLHVQHNTMHTYHCILQRRITRMERAKL